MPPPRTNAAHALDGGPPDGGALQGRGVTGSQTHRIGSYIWKAHRPDSGAACRAETPAARRRDGDVFERAFLRAAPHDQLKTLVLPRLRAVYKSGCLIDFCEREHQTRDTIQQRDWSDDDVRAFVRGLREFQEIAVRTLPFSRRHRLLGWAYPAFRLLSLDKRSAVLCLGYMLARPMWKNALTHYDLHTFNYAFTPDGRMSMLDFERMYASGDPLFDLLYFCTIPPVRMDAWTFQARLLREFLHEETPFARLRARVILLQCNLGRGRYSGVAPEVYEDNVALLRSGRRFRAWWRRITS